MARDARHLLNAFLGRQLLCLHLLLHHLAHVDGVPASFLACQGSVLQLKMHVILHRVGFLIVMSTIKAITDVTIYML